MSWLFPKGAFDLALLALLQAGPRGELEGGEVSPPPLNGVQPMPSHSLPDGRCQPQWLKWPLPLPLPPPLGLKQPEERPESCSSQTRIEEEPLKLSTSRLRSGLD